MMSKELGVGGGDGERFDDETPFEDNCWEW